MPEINPAVDRRYKTLGEVAALDPDCANRRRRFISLGDAAAYVGVNPRTIREWIKADRLTGYRFGPNTLRVDLAELDALGGA
jgi:excisionase family DNA binding protein